MQPILIFIAIVFGLVGAQFASAATLFFSESEKTVYEGDSFNAEVYIESKDAAINTGEIYVAIPKELEVTQVSTAKSIFKVWVNEPTAVTQGLVSFIGGLPTPGYSGNNGLLGVVSLKAKSVGTVSLDFAANSKLLLNDGLGTQAPLKLSVGKVNILPRKPGTTPESLPEIQDTIPPKNLNLILSRSVGEFDDKYFASFSAEDDESGIDHYEIATIPLFKTEPEAQDWVKAKSPYLLESVNQKVYLKAVDGAGNSAVVFKTLIVTPVKKKLFWILIILLIIILMSVWLIKRLKSQNKVQKKKKSR